MESVLPQMLLIAGVLLTVSAALSGVMGRTVLSISVLAVSAGIVLALTDVVTVGPGEAGLVEVIELALLLTLFADGLLVERELLRMHWGPPVRAIVVAMPLTLSLIALGAKLLFPELSWAEAFLLGAVLSPTDPVVTSTIVASPRVPQIVRHTLNLESGLNDGIALPFVLVLLVIAQAESGAGSEALALVGEVGVGVVVGAALGIGGGIALKRLPGDSITERYEGLYALGIGLASFGLAEVTVGNGFIAAFVAGVALGETEHELSERFVGFNENFSSIFQVVTFFLFGALIVTTGYQGSIPALAAFIVFALLVARPAAVAVAFLGSHVPRAGRIFVAWFGAKGAASMLFALFVINSHASDRLLVFDVASFAILASIAAHGLTDTLGAGWIERRMEEESRKEAAGDA